METENNLVPSDNSLKTNEEAAQSDHHTQPRTGLQPIIEYYYENQISYNNYQPNCLTLPTMSFPFLTNVSVPPTNIGHQKHDNYFYYQLMNNEQGYGCMIPRDLLYFQNVSNQSLYNKYITMKCWPKGKSNSALYLGKGDSFRKPQRTVVQQQKLSNKMHPVQLLHQLLRKEAFVMEYERMNGGPYSQVRVTYKVNGRMYHAEATRLKEARRLCAKYVLQDQFPDLEVESDNNIPQPEYDPVEFDKKHPVQILYQIFRDEPLEMHCEEEGAAHFAKHIFTFVIRGKKYQAKAETIKEAKRRAAILALNDNFKKGDDLSN